MKTKLILECGCNHNGDMDIAIKMIDHAHLLGAWAVKFQKRDVELIPDEMKKLPRDLSNSFGKTYYEHRKALEFSIVEMENLKYHAESKGLVFICSAFDINSIKELISYRFEYIKIPSQFADRKDFQNKIMPYFLEQNIFVSLGMRSSNELDSNIWRYGRVNTMHCISVYPHAINESCLSMLYREDINGYSSHGKEGREIQYAVMAGAQYIERHFTLDKTMNGSDHSTVSSEPEEIIRIIKEIEYVESILGDQERLLTDKEKKVRAFHMGR